MTSNKLSALISPSPVGGQDLPMVGDGPDLIERLEASIPDTFEEDGDGFYDTPLTFLIREAIAALSHPAPDRAVEALREFAQFVADYSNDPHVVKEAHKHLAASTGEANHG